MNKFNYNADNMTFSRNQFTKNLKVYFDQIVSDFEGDMIVDANILGARLTDQDPDDALAAMKEIGSLATSIEEMDRASNAIQDHFQQQFNIWADNDGNVNAVAAMSVISKIADMHYNNEDRFGHLGWVFEEEEPLLAIFTKSLILKK